MMTSNLCPRVHRNSIDISNRRPIILIITSSVFIFLFFRTAQILQHDRYEHNHVRFLYEACHAKLLALQLQTKALKGKTETKSFANSTRNMNLTVSPSVLKLLQSMKGTKAATGFNILLPLDSTKFILPHLGEGMRGLVPAYHMTGCKNMVDIVIGINTVKRNRANYLINTLKELIKGLTENDKKSTLIVIVVGEIDLDFVLRTARSIELVFPEEVKEGLIEVLSPSKQYYPDAYISTQFTDSNKRIMQWRSKHVLDTIFLNAYCESKGSYYLILEDDIIVAKDKYMTEVKNFVSKYTAINPNWLLIEFSHYPGGIGKFMRSFDIDHFNYYLQLFYYSMPLNNLIDRYLRNRACGAYRNHKSKRCDKSLKTITVTHSDGLFFHIGLFSSLSSQLEHPLNMSGVFIPHKNPPLKFIRCDMDQVSEHEIEMAYKGTTYFMGVYPKADSVIEFWFQNPTAIKRYKVQSGNNQHKKAIFTNAQVEVLKEDGSVSTVGVFDNFGLAEGKLEKFGLLNAFILRIMGINHRYSIVVISELELKALHKPNTSIQEFY